MKGYMGRLLPFLPGSSAAEKRRKFLILFPGMAGVLMTARMMTDPAARSEMLALSETILHRGLCARKKRTTPPPYCRRGT